MALKNRTSQSTGTFDKIQKILAEHGARKLMFDYTDKGQISSITFSIPMDGKEIGFRLPAMVENVTEIMYGGLDRYDRPKEITEANKEQAYRTAWANIRDWIDAQMAMVDTRQVKVEQVFLPYLIVNKDGGTLFEKMEGDRFLLNSAN